MRVIDACSDFDSNRFGNYRNEGVDEMRNCFGFFEERAPCAGADNLPRRTSTVDVNNIKGGFNYVCCCNNIVNGVAKKLDSNRLLKRICCEHEACFLVFMNECSAVDKFSIGESCTVAFSKSSKCNISYACHRT